MKVGAFQILSIITAATIYLLIVLGGLVSSTGSGLACPDWPLCYGEVFPTLTPAVLIEFAHRVWAAVVGVFVLVTMLLAWKKYRWPSAVTAFATLSFVLLLNQVVLGMVTVQSGTKAIIVTAHLALATLVFASALTASIISFTHAPRR